MNWEKPLHRWAAIVASVMVFLPLGSYLYKIMHLNDVERIEVNTMVPRIINAMNVRCQGIHKGNDVTTLENEIIEPLRARYHELTGREFNMGTCKDGKRVSSYAR